VKGVVAADKSGTVKRKAADGTDIMSYEERKEALDLAAYQEESLRREVSELRNRLNGYKHGIDKLEQAKVEFKNQLKVLSIEDDIHEQRQLGEGKLEKFKEKTKILHQKLWHTEDYEKTLKFMLQRLQKKKLTFDATMTAYEDALQVQQGELASVKILRGEVQQAKDTEEAELISLQRHANNEKVRLERELEEKRKEAVQREELAKWAGIKQARLAEAKAEAAGDMGEDEERRLIAQSQAVRMRTVHMHDKSKEMMTKLEEYDDMFREIRLATGIETVTAESVIQKFNGLSTEMAAVDEQVLELNNRIEQLTSAKAQAKYHLQHGDSTEGDDGVDRTMMSRMDRRLEAAKRGLDAATAEATRLREIKLRVMQTIDVLHDNVRSFKFPKQSALPNVEISLLPSSHPASTTVSRIKDIGQRLTYVMQYLSGQVEAGSNGRRNTASPMQGSTRRRADTLTRASTAKGAAADESPERREVERQWEIQARMDEMVQTNAWNIRIRPSSAKKNALTMRQINAAAAAFQSMQNRLGARNPVSEEPEESRSARERRKRRAKRQKKAAEGTGQRAAGRGGARSRPSTRGGERKDGDGVDAPQHESPEGGGTAPTQFGDDGIVARGAESGDEGMEASMDSLDSADASLPSLTRMASQHRRRSSRVELWAAQAAAAAHDSSGSSPKRTNKPTVSVPKLGGAARRKNQQSQLAKYAAAAVLMSGEEMDEFAMNTKDHEAVPTRAQLKAKAKAELDRSKRIKERKQRQAALEAKAMQ
jgi:hypothetical protein